MMAEHYGSGPEWLLPLLWVLAIDPELGQQPQDESCVDLWLAAPSGAIEHTKGAAELHTTTQKAVG